MRRRRDERGAVAIVVALSLTALLVVVALVLDFGLIRVDRQVDKSAADSATLAGLHALNGGDADPRPFVGVCTAIRYLQQNNDRFSDMTPDAGSWTNGNDVAWPTSDPCTDADYLDNTCTDTASWARFAWAGTQDGQPLHVVIQSGYLLATDSGYSEDSLPAAEAENDDSADGCNQLAVLINQTREPGLGSLATSSDLKTSIRSVGRVRQIAGGYAPAMLLLRRTGCPVLEVGAGGGGAGSFVHVYGKVSSNGFAQPGTIHADTDGSSCSGSAGNWVFYGKASLGIAAFAAPSVGAPLTPDPDKPGSITSYAATLGVDLDRIRDNSANVCASASLDLTCSGTDTNPTGLGRVTRRPVDERYKGDSASGVTGMVTSAQSTVFGATPPNNAAQAATMGYRYGTCSGPGAVTIAGAAPTQSEKVWINCATAKSFAAGSLAARTVVFGGKVDPGAVMSMPNATEVYVFGDPGNAINLGTGGAFTMNTTGNISGSTCNSAPNTGRAKLMIKAGSIRISGGLLRLCNTTVVMMGGQANGCVPTSSGTAPTLTPCGNSGDSATVRLGSGRITQSGGDIDWTAPNERDVMTLPDGEPDPLYEGLWTDTAGPEDLAFWSESGATSSSTTSTLGGNGVFHVQGVFMTPNYAPFTITGGGLLDLQDAQFIASRIELNGGTRIKMAVDPNSAVTLPRLEMVGLVR